VSNSILAYTYSSLLHIMFDLQSPTTGYILPVGSRTVMDSNSKITQFVGWGVCCHRKKDKSYQVNKETLQAAENVFGYTSNRFDKEITDAELLCLMCSETRMTCLFFHETRC